MMQRTLLSILCLLLITGSGCKTNKTKLENISVNNENKYYSNPVISESLPDPTILKAKDGYFYLYATENIRNIPIYKSKD